jgi:predicted TIM-barrel fold metal-dependent hydrolase
MNGGVVDAHIHVQPWSQFRPEAVRTMEARRADLDVVRAVCSDPKALLEFLDREGVERAVLVNYVSPDIIGFDDDVNRFVGDFCRGHEDRLVPVGGVHPRLSKDPAGDLERIVERHGIRVLKLHPPHQLFAMNAYRDGGALPGLATLYERAASMGVPVLVHTGTSVFPGARNKYGDPMALDDVAVDFPDLTIVMAHGGRPLWMEACRFLLRRHPNVFMDLSGIPPKNLLEFFPRLEELASKSMFGTDWPGPGVPGVRRNIEAFRALPLPDAAKTAILQGTADRIYPARRAAAARRTP